MKTRKLKPLKLGFFFLWIGVLHFSNLGHACGGVLSAEGGLQSMDQVKNLLIIAAMEVEEKALLGSASFEELTFSQRKNAKVKKISFGDKNIFITQSGVGAVNAAVATAMIAEKFPIDAIILLGVGGALIERLEVGDIVIAKTIVQHDSVISEESGNQLMAPGQLYLSLKPEERKPAPIATDKVLVGWLEQLAQKTGRRYYQGTLLSGSEFVGTADRKRAIGALHPEALMVDMEASGIAQIAMDLKIPMAAAKTVADRMRDGKITSDYNQFKDAAASYAALLSQNIFKVFGQ